MFAKEGVELNIDKRRNKMTSLNLKRTKHTLLKIFDKFNFSPRFAIITGSGVKVFNNHKPLFEIKYSELHIYNKSKKLSFNNNPQSTISGHESKLKLFRINKKDVLVFSGRKHLYQGYDIIDVVSNIKIASLSGVEEILITNAAGGLNKEFKAGDLMLITGFIDLMQATERGTLSGITQPPKIIKSDLTKKISARYKNKMRKGVYAGVIGPTYETYSEIQLLRSLNASAVGMSTVPELITAQSLGLDFAGISIISNVWDNKHKPSHKEVVKQVELANKKLNDLILQII